MKLRTPLKVTILLLIGAVTLFSVAPFAQGSPTAQLDPTAQEATINALVEDRFNQTMQAMNPAQTATAEANATLNFQATVDAVFAQRMTATAEAPLTAQATATEVPAGGVRIRFRAVEDASDEQLEAATRIIEQRLDAMNIPANVEFDDEHEEIHIRVAAQYEDAVIEVVMEPGLLEFVDFSGLGARLNEFVGGKLVTTAGEDAREEADADRDEDAMENPLTEDPFETVVTGDNIENAAASLSLDGVTWQVQFQFDDEGGERMTEFSREHIGEPLAIVLNGRVLSIPVIQAEFGMGGGLISGLSESDAKQVELALNDGALPARLRVRDVRRIDDGFPAQVVGNATRTMTPTPAASPTFDPRPTATTGEIQVAEEVFEGGRMFWVEPTQQIWVMIIEGEGRGTWGVYEDTFVEGEPEFDPSLLPPDGMYQPERGFGKLWRENEEIRDALGWAVTPEFGYTSRYEYHPGGEVVNGQFVPAPGYHVLFTLYGEAIRFNEADGTWSFASN